MNRNRWVAFVGTALLLSLSYGTGIAQVTGSGTPRFITKWNTTSSINNSGIYQFADPTGNGNYYGLNTTTPNGVLGIQCRNGYEIFGSDTTGTGWNLDLAASYHLHVTPGIKVDGTVFNPLAHLGLGGGGLVDLVTLDQKRLTVVSTVGMGIGATADTEFVSGYRLKVGGKIRAKEIKVDTGWSDFVFDPDRRLTPLPELEATIQNQRHLPGIPTAREVAEHGVSLGEMDAKLLEKVEELTLYVINLDKQNQQLKKEVAELKRQR